MKKYIVLLAMLVAGAANAASFDCALASSRIDNAICASPQVSKLDGELAVAYQAASAKSSEPDAVKTAQRLWLKQTRNACQDEACLVTVYQQRIAALAGGAISDAPPAPVNTEQEEAAADANLAVEEAKAAEQAAVAASAAQAEAAASAAAQAQKVAEQAAMAASAAQAKVIADQAVATATDDSGRKLWPQIGIGGSIALVCAGLGWLWLRPRHNASRSKAVQAGRMQSEPQIAAVVPTSDSEVLPVAKIETSSEVEPTKGGGVNTGADSQWLVGKTARSANLKAATSDIGRLDGDQADINPIPDSSTDDGNTRPSAKMALIGEAIAKCKTVPYWSGWLLLVAIWIVALVASIRIIDFAAAIASLFCIGVGIANFRRITAKSLVVVGILQITLLLHFAFRSESDIEESASALNAMTGLVSAISRVESNHNQRQSTTSQDADQSADPVDELRMAYLSFDDRCRQAVGPSTAQLLNTMDEIRRLGGDKNQGIGSVNGQLAMLRSIGCAPR